MKNKTSLQWKLDKRIYPIFYTAWMPRNGINKTEKRDKQIIISMTSFPQRFHNIHITLNSLLNQTLKPDRIILYLDDTVFDTDLTERMKRLRQVGVEIYYRPEKIKPHKKYYYAMKENPDSIIVTADDDIIYDRDWLKSLYDSYLRYPQCVSARRVHRIRFQDDGKNIGYNKWEWECCNVLEPSMELFATGVGGVLYPPHCMDEKVFDLEMIKSFCVNADDIWLKFMQLLAGTKVVWVPSKDNRLHTMKDKNQIGLNYSNVGKNINDVYFSELMKQFHLSSRDFMG